MCKKYNTTKEELLTDSKFYGLTNPDEFISEFFTNQMFIEELNTLGELDLSNDKKYSKIFKKILDWILDLIIIPSKFYVDASKTFSDIILNTNKISENRRSVTIENAHSIIDNKATISTRNGVPVWISPDGSLVKELTPKEFQVTVDSLVNNNAYNKPYSSSSEIKSQTMNRWGLWKDQKYREGVIVEGKWNAKKKGIELTKVELDNPTTLSDTSYAALSPAEREIAKNCHSK